VKISSGWLPSIRKLPPRFNEVVVALLDVGADVVAMMALAYDDASRVAGFAGQASAARFSHARQAYFRTRTRGVLV
jgi:hypothetical protein